MLNLITFIIKIIIATISGIFLSYVNKSFNNDSKILPLIILTIITSIVFSFSVNIEIFFLACIFLVHSITKTFKVTIKLMYYSAVIIGLLIGNGDILEVLVFCVVIYSVNNNSDSIENFFTGSERKKQNE